MSAIYISTNAILPFRFSLQFQFIAGKHSLRLMLRHTHHICVHVIIRCSQYCTYENIITMIMVIVMITYCLISKKSYVNEERKYSTNSRNLTSHVTWLAAAVGEVCQDICTLFLLPGHGQW